MDEDQLPEMTEEMNVFVANSCSEMIINAVESHDDPAGTIGSILATILSICLGHGFTPEGQATMLESITECVKNAANQIDDDAIPQPTVTMQ